jgi:hypothetical protein
VVPVGIQDPEEEARAEDAHLGASIAVPVPHHRHVARDTAEGERAIDALLENTVAIAIENPEVALPEETDLT